MIPRAAARLDPTPTLSARTARHSAGCARDGTRRTESEANGAGQRLEPDAGGVGPHVYLSMLELWRLRVQRGERIHRWSLSAVRSAARRAARGRAGAACRARRMSAT